MNFAAVAAAAADDVIKNVEGGGDAEKDAEKDAEMAKMAKTCEVLVMKCELLELEKRSIEEKLAHVTEVASTASSLVQKLDDALESHDRVLAETRAERDELRATLDSTDRRGRAVLAGGERRRERRRPVPHARRAIRGARGWPRRPRATRRRRARLLGAGQGVARVRARASTPAGIGEAPTGVDDEVAPRRERRAGVRAHADQIARLRPARQGARVRQSRDRVPASGAHRRGSQGESRGGGNRVVRSHTQIVRLAGRRKFGRREAERLAEKELARARRDAERAREELAMAKITHEAELGDMARSAATARGVEGVWVKLADAARDECDANKAALARTEAELRTARKEGRAMCAAAFSAMAAAAGDEGQAGFSNRRACGVRVGD